MPAIATIAGLGIDAFIRQTSVPRVLRLSVTVLLIGLGAVCAQDMRSLHPYEYLYFNRASGGLRRQADRFETDYWGLSYREAFDWVVHNVDLGGVKAIHVSACNINGPLRYYREQWNARRFVVEDQVERAQISLAMLRGECSDVSGTILHAVQRQGVPLTFIRRRQPSGLHSRH
jgi:hypothetical protein